MKPARILVVEDEQDQRRILSRILAREGHQVREAASAEEALQELGSSLPDVVVSDWKLPGQDGLALLRRVQNDYPSAAFIMATAYGSISHAVEAVQAGADDYLVKPFQREVLLLAVERALKAHSLAEQNRLLSQALDERQQLVDLLGRAPAMQRIFRRLEKVAATEATILISGESGTGKGLAARTLHALSARKDEPFVTIDCAAIPEGLVEAELFGSEKGAYTGAEARRQGKFEAAQSGTVLLDEVGELPLHLQPKLLRVLQEGRYSRVGSNRELSADVRLIAATNRDLEEEVAQGRFRQDLFYRLNVVPIVMPPLRERREDIPLLASHFLHSAGRRHQLSVPEELPSAILRWLMDFDWPGNVRQLQNLIERLVLFSEEGRLDPADLPAEVRPEEAVEPGHGDAHGDVVSGPFRLPEEGLDWESHEKSLLSQALSRSQGNRAQAARLLGLTYKAFLYRLEKHGLSE
ncbi:MAG TPA: sigma-54 dependent transcriptional regulator [Acidobacteriota bacterium]|nr:sigma-54 dependent transcriptional regulator [Acidobacteriota bacterium]